MFVPLFNYLMKMHREAYFFIFFILLFISLIFDLYNHFSRKAPLQTNVIQTFRIWTWGTYYMLGGAIGDKDMDLSQVFRHDYVEFLTD